MTHEGLRNRLSRPSIEAAQRFQVVVPITYQPAGDYRDPGWYHHHPGT